MRTGIHPEYVECKVHCSCGSEFVTRSTKPKLQIELCSQCHPFYTGKQKFVDTGGRVQRFADKYAGSKDTVIAKDAAAKQARQKAHEESLVAAREARAAKDAVEAEKAREEADKARRAEAKFAKSRPAEAVAEEAPSEDAVAEAVEETAPEAVAEESAVEAVEEAPAEEAPVEAEAADEPAAEEPAE
jgi:large subunit ribosomal protein L31